MSNLMEKCYISQFLNNNYENGQFDAGEDVSWRCIRHVQVCHKKAMVGVTDIVTLVLYSSAVFPDPAYAVPVTKIEIIQKYAR